MRRTKRKSIIKNAILGYINSNAKTYLIVTIMFLIGLIIGIIFVNNTNQTQQESISNYITGFVQSLNSNYQISQAQVLKNAIINNFFITLILWFLGLTVIGIPLIYMFVIYKGYSIGYTIAAVIATLGTAKGIIFLIATMFLQYLIYIPCVLSLAVSGIKLYRMIMEDRRKENIKIQIIRHTLFCILILIVLIVASIIEAYLSVNLTTWLIKYC